MKTEIPDNIVHEHFCRKQPKEEGIRTERYDSPIYGADGITVVDSKSIHRCIECGARTLDGVPEQHLRAS